MIKRYYLIIIINFQLLSFPNFSYPLGILVKLMNLTDIDLTGTFRPQLSETTFVFTLEPLIKNRPIIMLWMVDASHSMRFYIDEAKTIQRQSLVQAVAQLGINDHEIIQNDDRLGIFTFSTEVKNLLESKFIAVSEENRNEIDQIIGTSLKSDGGQTNYGKAFNHLLETIESINKELPPDAPQLAGPILIWFLTDGRPWPEVAGNTTEDIYDFASKLGETGNELWIIGISEDANKEFLEKISLENQHGNTNYNKKVQDLPKEFLLEELVSEKTLWVDLNISSQEALMHGLVNAIEGARTNLGIVAEVEIVFQNDYPIVLSFPIGVNEVTKDGLLTKVKLKRFDFLKIGQKMSMAFSLKTEKELLMHTKLHSITLELFRGDTKISADTVIYNQPLFTLIKEETKEIKGLTETKNAYESLRNDLKQTGYQIQDLLNTMEALAIKREIVKAGQNRFESVKKFLSI